MQRWNRLDSSLSSLLVAIPAYNASSTLATLLSRIQRVWVGPILVVDDGSQDNTSEIARAYGVPVIRHAVNMGKGQALATAFQYALDKHFEGVIHLDADLQHPPEWIPHFIQTLQHAHLVIGSRHHELYKMPRDRQLSNRLTSLVLSVMTGQPIPDSQSGFRAIRTSLLSRIFPLWTSRYDTESEILYKALRLKARVVFLPIPVLPTSMSHMNRWMDTLRFLKLLAKMMWHL